MPHNKLRTPEDLSSVKTEKGDTPYTKNTLCPVWQMANTQCKVTNFIFLLLQLSFFSKQEEMHQLKDNLYYCTNLSQNIFKKCYDDK